MAIMRFSKGKKNPYFQVHNSTINDPLLSWQAKGLLCYLISKPDHWYVNYHNLVSSSTNGIKSVRSILKELIESGYLFRSQLRSDDGKFSYYDFTVYEISQKPKYIKNKLAPYSPKRHAVTRHAFKGTLANTDKKENTENNNNSTVVNPISSKSCVAVLLHSNSKTKTIKLLKELHIKNYKKLFDLFPISDIFMYSNWMKSRTLNILNPTGFLITAIREKWIDGMDLESYYNENLLFYYRCQKCNTVFGYPEEIENYTFCNKCRGS
ncbi:MAG: hypothetical protein GH151_13775 [Bacteroidetes bacterium]|nr:hypothetical protein [Bacteroidota bacterium]